MFPSCALGMVAADHLAHFIRNVVREQLDLNEILQSMPRSEAITLSFGDDDGSVVVCQTQWESIPRDSASVPGEGGLHGTDRDAEAGFSDHQPVSAAAPASPEGAV